MVLYVVLYVAFAYLFLISPSIGASERALLRDCGSSLVFFLVVLWMMGHWVYCINIRDLEITLAFEL